jgi:hypothetical protein
MMMMIIIIIIIIIIEMYRRFGRICCLLLKVAFYFYLDYIAGRLKGEISVRFILNNMAIYYVIH